MKVFPLLPSRTNILFVGDNVGRLKDISFELQRAWCSVLWETRGIEGIRTAKTELPDMIICETNLPDISGLDVCQRVRSDSEARQIPIVLVGHSEIRGADLEAFEAGADEYFLLPNESERLLSKLFWLVEGGHSKPGSIVCYNKLRSQQTHISRILKETSDLLQNLGRESTHVGLGRPRAAEIEPNIYNRINLGMHLIGVAADLFEEEAREPDLTEPATIGKLSTLTR